MGSIPIQKAVQLFGQLYQALRGLTLNICGRFPKVWRDIFGPRLRGGCSCCSLLEFWRLRDGDLIGFRALAKACPLAIVISVGFRACVTFLHFGV